MILKYCVGFLILNLFYLFGLLIAKVLILPIPPAIIGLILYIISLKLGLIKDSWVKNISEALTNNITLFLLPFVAGLIVYKTLLYQNLFLILAVIFISSFMTIVLTGLFVQNGIKYLRLIRIRRKK